MILSILSNSRDFIRLSIAKFEQNINAALLSATLRKILPLHLEYVPATQGRIFTMLIGVPKEIKNHEYRVGMTPMSVREAARHGHKVWVQTKAGEGIGASDADYVQAGAMIIPTAEEI